MKPTTHHLLPSKNSWSCTVPPLCATEQLAANCCCIYSWLSAAVKRVRRCLYTSAGGGPEVCSSSGRSTVQFGLHRQWDKLKIFGNVKAKAKLALCTPGGGMGGVHVYLHLFVTSVLDGGEWSASGRGRYALRLRSKPRYDIQQVGR